MIKFKLSQLVLAVQSGAFKKLEEQQPPGAYKFKCVRITDALMAEYQRYVKLQTEAIKKYGVPNPETGAITVANAKNTPENVIAFNDAINDLLDGEVELKDFDPVSFTQLGQKAQEALSIGDLRLLGPFLVES